MRRRCHASEIFSSFFPEMGGESCTLSINNDYLIYNQTSKQLFRRPLQILKLFHWLILRAGLRLSAGIRTRLKTLAFSFMSKLRIKSMQPSTLLLDLPFSPLSGGLPQWKIQGYPKIYKDIQRYPYIRICFGYVLDIYLGYYWISFGYL
jgi:hypothetical protein